ncbi:hypothetical protein C1H46_001699 [Malus baccata]|uniref:Uncharacterized protein n=1 Tax=Malus baccata TaxID=106549 RepID=A0A540NNS3_MALBA|nr:hypothetical protein C1H46_001699 [Malus baccata]
MTVEPSLILTSLPSIKSTCFSNWVNFVNSGMSSDTTLTQVGKALHETPPSNDTASHSNAKLYIAWPSDALHCR